MSPYRSEFVPKLIIVIVSYKSKGHLKRCLLSLQEDPPKIAHQVVVVDNASGDGTTSLVRDNFPQVLLLEEKKNLGFAKGCNRVLQFPPPQYILFLNPDVTVEEGAIDLMISLLEKREEIGIAGGGLWGVNQKLQPTYREFPTYGNLFATKRNPLGRLLGKAPQAKEEEKEVDSVAGAFMMIRGELFHQLGGFDERFFMYVEDVDLCYRAKRTGKKVFYFPQARAWHLWGGSTELCRKRMKVEHHRSLYRFFEKHYPHPLRNLLLAWLLLLNLGITLAEELLREVFFSKGPNRPNQELSIQISDQGGGFN